MGCGERILQVVVCVAILAPPALVARYNAVKGGNILRVPHLRAPIGAAVGLPRIAPTTAEAIGRKPHDLERAVSGEDHQIAPGKRTPVFLLDRPDQAP